MIGFVAWASLCALAAALCVALPLLRTRADGAPRQRALGWISGSLVAIAALALYALWSNGAWRASPARGSDTIETLLAATEQRPDDVQAWLDLGRAYLRSAQWPLARRSFQHADRLSNGGSAAALSGLGETIVFENAGRQDAAAEALFERALKLDPRSPQALFYTGIALYNAGDLPAARARFASLRALGPPAEVVDALDKQIAAIDVEIARRLPDPATRIRLLVRLAAPLAGQLPAGAALFVFARAPGGGPPLAARRLEPEFPQQVALSAADSMIAGNALKAGQRVEIIARISARGSPTGGPGDLYGRLTAVAGAGAERVLTIDQRNP